MIKNIAVLGAGNMGHGIAEVFAMGGYPVSVYETYEPLLLNVKDTIKEELELLSEHGLVKSDEIPAILDRIELHSDPMEAVGDADFVIESTSEEINLKRNVFTLLDENCKPETIFASNTSSFSLKDMTDHLSPERKKKVMICHWYNPSHIMPIIEIFAPEKMREEDVKKVEALYKKSGKETIRVKKDIPGLISSRINMSVAREIFSLMEQGAAEPADIDKALKYGPALSYATTGQLEVADMGGLDIWSSVADRLLAVMDNSNESNALLKEKVRNGKLGMKSGEGFYKYSEGEKSLQQKKFHENLLRQLKVSKKSIDR